MKKCLLLPHPEKEKVAGIRGLSKAQGFLAGDLLRGFGEDSSSARLLICDSKTWVFRYLNQ